MIHAAIAALLLHIKPITEGGVYPIFEWFNPEPLSPLFKTGGYFAGYNEDLVQIGLSMLFLLVIDFGLIKHVIHPKGRYFALHAVVNFFVVIVAFPDLLKTIMDPVEAFHGPSYSIWANSAIAAIHVYHCIVFPLRADEIFHHVQFASILCALSIPFKQDYGTVSNFGCFFLSGLPGGLDYILLTLVQHGVVTKMFEKTWNARINVWLRGPAMTVFAFLAWQSWLRGKIGTLSPIALLITTILYYTNGQYYTRQAVESYATWKERAKAEKAAKKQ